MSTPLRTEPSLTDYAAERGQALDDRIERAYLDAIEDAGSPDPTRALVDRVIDELREYEWAMLVRSALHQISRNAGIRRDARVSIAHRMEEVLLRTAEKQVATADQRTLDLGEEGAP